MASPWLCPVSRGGAACLGCGCRGRRGRVVAARRHERGAAGAGVLDQGTGAPPLPPDRGGGRSRVRLRAPEGAGTCTASGPGVPILVLPGLLLVVSLVNPLFVNRYVVYSDVGGALLLGAWMDHVHRQRKKISRTAPRRGDGVEPVIGARGAGGRCAGTKALSAQSPTQSARGAAGRRVLRARAPSARGDAAESSRRTCAAAERASPHKGDVPCANRIARCRRRPSCRAAAGGDGPGRGRRCSAGECCA